MTQEERGTKYWILVNNGDVFEGDELHWADVFFSNFSVQLVLDFCTQHGWQVEIRNYQPTSATRYDKNYGDDKLCLCGHPYYRHFDTYDNMNAIGCKYCMHSDKHVAEEECAGFKRST